MRGRTLAVLMWKHLMVRKKRFVQTPLELLSPIAFFVLLCVCLDNPIQPPGSHDSPVRHTDALHISDLVVPRRVFYYPDTNLTHTLMDVVGKKIKLFRFEGEALEHEGRYYSAVQNISSFVNYVANFQTDEALIMFKGMQDPSSSKLNYSIRIKSSVFHVETFRSMDESLTPQAQFGTIYEEFMVLQWAIDTSYITLLSGFNITQDLELQEFPYYGRDLTSRTALIRQLCSTCSWLAFLLYFVVLMCRLLEERVSGVQELVKMVGVSPTSLHISQFLNVLPCGLIYAIVVPCMLTLPPNALVPHSNALMMFIILLLQFLSITAMAFACSYTTNTTQYSVSIAVFMYILLCVPALIVSKWNLSYGVRLLVGILPSTSINWYWQEIAALEAYEYGLSWSDAWVAHSSESGPYVLSVLYLFIQTVIFFALAFYLGFVRPGKYGQALPWNFLFQKQYWSKVEPDIDSFEETPIVREEIYFEKPLKNADVGIKISNISKVFPKQKALSNVDLEIYKGEITVLLGHNGAGKTTLMSIITGMISPSQGKVYVNGLDMSRYRNDVRKTIGFCPQHNLFFPELNVLEHVIFFSLLKTGTYSEAKASSLRLLDQLGLSNKAYECSSALSGGMKRRLQLACALAGAAELLVLDEPTAGLDVQTRRDLWDLLLSLRGFRTVVLSTHFMEEAEALGDRVAALHHGRLRCLATTMHLKRAIGTGYRLSLTTNGLPREEAIASLILSYIPEATVTNNTINSITYSLPAANSNKFPELFAALEDKRSELGIENVGVGISTLEEVFIKLCSDTDFSMSEDELDCGRPETTHNKVTGLLLYWRQFLVLCKRQFHFILAKKLYFISMQIVIPILLITMFTNLMSARRSESFDSEMQLDLDLYSPLEDKRVMYKINSFGADIQPLKNKYKNVQFISSDNVYEDMIKVGNKSVIDYNKYLFGIELNDTNAKVLYTAIYRHTAPTALNMLTNLLASQYLSNTGDSNLITTYNYPVENSIALASDNIVQPKSLDNAVTWTMLIIFVLTTTLITLTTLPCKERQSGTRHIHIMTGCPAAVHFGTTLIFHVTLTTYTIIVAVIINCFYMETEYTLDQPDFMFCMFVVLVLSTLSFLALSYFISFYFGELGTGIILFAFLIVFGIITPVYQLFTSMSDEAGSFGVYLCELIEYIIPPHTITVAAAKTVYNARINALCDLNRDKCPNLPVYENGFDIARCCSGMNTRCYYCWDDYAPLKRMIILIVQFFVYMSLVLMCERGVFARIWERVVNVRYQPPPNNDLDEIVRAEKVFVEKEIGLDPKVIKEANISLLVNDVHKKYLGLFKSCNAVKGISFSVKEGECFGLLGVNGAGKSTTFKMLTADEYPTRGEIFGNGYQMNTQPDKYLRTIGYCPQFFGLDDFMTGLDNIKVLLTLRGFDSKTVDSEANTWIKLVGLEKYLSRKVSGYSGGMSRRLGAAGALCSGGSVCILDEPTAGVDVAVRRRVWTALRGHKARGRVVLISSHSMEEMEALCGRVAVLARGALRALGSPAALRARHATGHALLLKLTHTDPHASAGDQTDSEGVGAEGAGDINTLKNALHAKFNCTLKDEHKTMLHYHINETMRNSELFKELEELKSTYPYIIEDYSISETTLEEVFLSFAKEAADEHDNRNGVV